MSAFNDELWKKIEDQILNDLFYSGKKSSSETFTWSTINKEDMWDEGVMEKDYRKSGKKVFSAQVHTLAKTEYFATWAGTRLGVTPEIAKAIIHRRLIGSPPSEIAEVIAKNSSIAEVRNSCETYLNDLKGT